MSDDRYIQQCRSVIVTHPLEWIQHYHHLMVSDEKSPLQNVVEVKRPLEEHLPGVMKKLLDPANAEWVERITDMLSTRMLHSRLSSR
jgi:hypothetical protein